MERKAHRTGRFLVRLLALSLVGYVVAALGRDRPAVEPEPRHEARPDSFASEHELDHDVTPERRRRFAPRRLAVGLALTAIFFAGAAFTAGAGNEVAGLLEQTSSTDAATTTDASASATAPADPSSTSSDASVPAASDPSAAPADTSASSAVDGSASSDPSAAAPADDSAASGHGADSNGVPASSDASGSVSGSSGSVASAAPTVTPAPAPSSHQKAAPKHRSGARSGGSQWVLRVPHEKRSGHHAPAASAAQEAKESPSTASVIWLNRTLPDPTPPSRRLNRRFASRLQSTSRAHHVDWALVLGVLRAQGRTGAVPATRAELRRTEQALAAVRSRGDANAALAVTGNTAVADQAVALGHYNHAVGLRGLVDGLLAHKGGYVNRLLHDGRATVYDGGREDLASGRVDVRVVVLIEYLADTYGQVTVSCLISGHRLYARPGVISAHIYGRAVDIADLGGISIYGHQEPGGITEKAVRAILLLPSELQPKQVISLLGLGGPSFPLADHADHIHVGY